jgi:hypothetical protein
VTAFATSFFSFSSLVIDGQNASSKRIKIKEQALQTAKFTDCRQAVLSFALAFGYMTRDIMSPQELEAKIASGIDADDLLRELYTRMGKIPGIFLGQRTAQDGGMVDVKLASFIAHGK